MKGKLKIHKNLVLITRKYVKNIKHSWCKSKFNDGNIKNRKEKKSTTEQD